MSGGGLSAFRALWPEHRTGLHPQNSPDTRVTHVTNWASGVCRGMAIISSTVFFVYPARCPASLFVPPRMRGESKEAAGIADADPGLGLGHRRLNPPRFLRETADEAPGPSLPRRFTFARKLSGPEPKPRAASEERSE